MKLRPHLLIALTALTALAAACSGDGEGDGAAKANGAAGREVVVFAAASLRESLQELGAAWERESGARVVFNFAGSNDLAHQITAGRGMDLFLSASERWMDEVERAGRLAPGTRRDLLSNTLVVVTHRESYWMPRGPCDLPNEPFRHLAMGDPDAVPAGTYARDWMRSVSCGGETLWDALRARVTPTPDVRAAMGLVLADRNVVGMVYRTDQIAFADQTRVIHEVRDGPPIRYALAQLADGANPEGARRFHAYLAGPQGARVFARHGFTPLASPVPADSDSAAAAAAAPADAAVPADSAP